MGLIAGAIWWFWPASPSEGEARVPSNGLVADVAAGDGVMESAIMPLSEAPTHRISPTTEFTPRPVKVLTQQLTDKFATANELAATGQHIEAERLYQELINEEKYLVEPYLNLAALYAQQNNLERAQQVLVDGLITNEKYGSLFRSLQGVLGALAAKAYHQALEQDGAEVASIDIPVIRSIGVDQQQLALVQKLERQLAEFQEQAQRAEVYAAAVEAERAKVQDLSAELAGVKQQLVETRSSSESELLALSSKLDEQSAVNQNLLASNERSKAEDMALLSAAQEASQRAEAERADLGSRLEQEQTERARLEKELQQQKQQLVAMQTRQLELEEQQALDRARAEEWRKEREQLLAQQANDAEATKLALQRQQQAEAKQRASAEELARQQTLALQQKDADAKLRQQQAAAARQKQLALQKEEARLAQLAKEQEQQRLESLAQQEREAAAKKRAAEEQTRLAALAQEAEQQRQQTLAANRAAAAKQEQGNEAIAVSLVKSWADAWARQSVSDYVNHYADDYATSGLSRDQWLEQRRVRLTNKAFINVDVSSFQVKPSEAGFSVSFVQRYRSNTMDDTIRKRLTFASQGDDWSQAKIVGEQVLR